MQLEDHSQVSFDVLQQQLPAIQAALRADGLDGWLLYDLHARNPVAGRLLGLGELSRRYFVLVPAEGEPLAVTHGIEQMPWQHWPWKTQSYVAWRELDERMAALVGGRKIAMEVSAVDAVPAVDMVPAGVLELVRKAGADVVSSGGLITRFYSCWTAEGLASHRRAGRVLADVAREAFDHLAEAVSRGEAMTEGALKRWLVAQLEARGAGVGADAIVANGVNAANPHYETGDVGATFQRGDVVLIDLWSKEREDAIYADQTWMGYLGAKVPDRVQELWEAIRDGRDAAVSFLKERWGSSPIQGYEVDDVTRRVIDERGYGQYFIHRTGHSIDEDTHGMGPNIDNLETHEVRALIPGVGFSIEPGIYVPNDVGLRTEINVYVSEDGPEVSSPDMQAEIFTLLEEGD